MLIRRFCLFFLAALVAASASAQTPPRKDRVYLRDIEGIWINEQYLKLLAELRSPHGAAKKVPPVVIAIKREGRSTPIVVTDFNKASIQAVLDIEPDGKPGSYRLVLGADDRPMSADEVKYLRFEGTKNAQDRFDRLRMAELVFMKGKWADYTPVSGELNPALNRVVLAGRYKDEKNRIWEFTESGEARWPEQTFGYELSLNDPTATCDYLQTEDTKEGDGKKRYGYSWKAGKLTIFTAHVAGKKVLCDAKPLAVLDPQ